MPSKEENLRVYTCMLQDAHYRKSIGLQFYLCRSLRAWSDEAYAMMASVDYFAKYFPELWAQRPDPLYREESEVLAELWFPSTDIESRIKCILKAIELCKTENGPALSAGG